MAGPFQRRPYRDVGLAFSVECQANPGQVAPRLGLSGPVGFALLGSIRSALFEKWKEKYFGKND